jgi:LPS-assembly lipoprotein
MSCSDPRPTPRRGRWAPAALLLLSLGGCGFHPLYAERTPLGYDPALAAIDVRPVPERDGQILAAAVREELNPRGATVPQRYVLNIDMSVARSDLGIRRDNTSSRGELSISVSLRLATTGSETPVFRDSLRSITAFNVPDDAYAATVAEQHAREQAADALGREIAARVGIFLHRQEAGVNP